MTMDGSAVFGEMCLGCTGANNPRGTDAPILRQHRPLMSIKSFVLAQQVGQVTGDGVLMLTNLLIDSFHICGRL